MSHEAIELEERYGAHNYHPLPVVCSRAEGVYIWDVEGKQYYDFLSAYSAVNQGHCHPRLVRVLTEQSQKLAICSRAFHNDQLGVYAKFVTEYFDQEMLLPMNTGAEAVETGMKLARKWAYKVKGVPEGKAIILGCQGNFHGRTFGAISLSTDPESRGGFGPYLPRVGATCPVTEKIIRYNNLGDLEAAFTAHGPHLAALLVEPIQGEAGIIVPDPGYLRRCAELCKKHRTLFIADEIQTGLGRTGARLACDHEQVKPDILLLGKALSGGIYPVSAVLSSREVMLCIGPGEHGSTYGGNPLACAIAVEALKILQEEQLAHRAALLGERLRAGLVALGSPLIKTVRGKGLLNAIVIGEDQQSPNAWRLCLLMKRHGVLAKPTHGNIIRLAPPLTITAEQIDDCLGRIGRALNEFPIWDFHKDPLE